MDIACRSLKPSFATACGSKLCLEACWCEGRSLGRWALTHPWQGSCAKPSPHRLTGIGAAAGGIEQAAELARQGLVAEQEKEQQQQEVVDLYQQEDELLDAQQVQDRPGKVDDTLLEEVPVATDVQVRAVPAARTARAVC